MPESNADTLSNILKRSSPVGAPLKPAEPVSDEAEPDALTIAQMDGKYSTMRPANKPLTRIHVVLKDGKVRTFYYHYLDVESSFEGGVFKLLFVGTKHWSITVKGHGPKFWAAYDYISLFRWPYLREATGSMPGVKEDGETVFTEIKITDVTPRSED